MKDLEMNSMTRGNQGKNGGGGGRLPILEGGGEREDLVSGGFTKGDLRPFFRVMELESGG